MKKYMLTILLLVQLKAEGQNSNHFGIFPTIDHSGTISSRLDYSFYYFGGLNLLNEDVKGTKEPANFFVFYSEQALTYKVNVNLSFTGSYVYERQRPLESAYRNENRFYIQGTYKYNLGKTALKHRLRYDGRFIENRTTGVAPFTSRIRYLFGLTTPLQKGADKLYFSAYNEFFFNTNKAAVAIYGENWAYMCIGLKTGKASSIEMGPLYIFWVNNSRNELSNFYYMQLTWSTHIDLTKEKATNRQ